MRRRVFTLFWCVFLLSPLAIGQKTHAPLTEGEVIRLLQAGVPPQHVGTLAQESGITFDVTPAVESDLRDAGADTELIATLREVAASRAGTKSTKDSPKTSSPGGNTGTLLIAADSACKLRIDGDDAGELTPDTPKRAKVAFGQHLVRAVSSEDPTISTQWSGSIANSEQMLVQLNLADKIALAKARREKPARDFVGTWIGTMRSPGGYTFPVTIRLNDLAPGERCGVLHHPPPLDADGNLKCVKMEDRSLTVYQTVTRGRQRCLDGLSVLTLIDNDTMERVWIDPATGVGRDKGLLKRQKE